jgi:hypothetical protein
MGADKHEKKWRTRGAPLGTASKNRFKDLNGPPQDEQWTWEGQTMLDSLAWKAMPIYARQILDRLKLEHIFKGGIHNGELVVTYDDFERYGVRRKLIPKGIAVSVALGFIDITTKGRSARDAGGRLPSLYALTSLPRADTFQPATNRWKYIVTTEQVEEALNPVVKSRMLGAITPLEPSVGDAPVSGVCANLLDSLGSVSRGENAPTYIDSPEYGMSRSERTAETPEVPAPPPPEPATPAPSLHASNILARTSIPSRPDPNPAPRMLADGKGTILNKLIQNANGTIDYRHGHGGIVIDPVVVASEPEPVEIQKVYPWEIGQPPPSQHRRRNRHGRSVLRNVGFVDTRRVG